MSTPSPSLPAARPAAPSAALPLAAGPSPPPVPVREVVRTWWPLAASWILMGAELPAVGAIVARLEQPDVHLAAWGGVVFPVALLVEAPIIMMLAASTALCRDRDAYRKVLRFTTAAGAALTVLHALLAFTPLYDLVVVALIRPPAEVVEPGRLGLMIMTPWTWAIADRRFHQGVLIRGGRSRAVGVGTLVRLVATGSVLALGLATRALPGIAIAGAAVTTGVVVELVVARLLARPAVRALPPPLPGAEPLRVRALLAFYVPLALTPLFVLAMQPIGSAAISRLPDALACLAVWPVLNGLVFVHRSAGMAFNEVVVRHAGEREAHAALARFALLLAAGTGLLLLAVATTPLADLWFARVSGLRPHLAELGVASLWLGVLLPPLTVLQSLWQGHLTHARRTRAVTEAVALLVVTAATLLWLAVRFQLADGLRAVLVAYTAGSLVQTGWLGFRARGLAAEPSGAPAASGECEGRRDQAVEEPEEPLVGP